MKQVKQPNGAKKRREKGKQAPGEEKSKAARSWARTANSFVVWSYEKSLAVQLSLQGRSRRRVCQLPIEISWPEGARSPLIKRNRTRLRQRWSHFARDPIKKSRQPRRSPATINPRQLPVRRGSTTVLSLFQHGGCLAYNRNRDLYSPCGYCTHDRRLFAL